MKLAVFIERDGVLNHVRSERQVQITPLSLSEFHLKLDAVLPLRRLQAAGFVVLATTNQPGLSRGYQSRRDLDLMHELMRGKLGLDGILVCPHDETDRCPCRKPKPGLLTEAAFTWHFDLDHSFVISDKWLDADAARQVGCTSLMIRSQWIGQVHHDFVVPSLEAAVEKLLHLHTQQFMLTH
ncbi:MAG: HAD-IIIA family hydrolase [Verrucomicrobiota bacterium]